MGGCKALPYVLADRLFPGIQGCRGVVRSVYYSWVIDLQADSDILVDIHRKEVEP